MPVRLVPASNGKSIRLDKPVLLIGRNPDCDVVLKCSRKVSRMHCLLAVSDDRVIVRDLASTNGVWINGHRVDRESHMKLGDELSVADVLYYLINEDQAGRDSSGEEQREHRETLDEPGLREARAADGLRNVPMSLLEPGIDVPVPIPEEEDSFAVEASMANLPRIPPGKAALANALEGWDSSGSGAAGSSPLPEPAPPPKSGKYFQSADEDSGDVIPIPSDA